MKRDEGERKQLELTEENKILEWCLEAVQAHIVSHFLLHDGCEMNFEK